MFWNNLHSFCQQILPYVSTVISLVTLGVFLKNSKPRIELRVINQDPYCELVDKYSIRNFFLVKGNDRYAYVQVEIENSSDKAGSVYDIFLSYKGSPVHGEAVYKDYPKTSLKVKVETENQTARYNENFQNLKQPIYASPFSYAIGFIRFPYFNADCEVGEIITATLEYKVTGSNKTHTKEVNLVATYFEKQNPQQQQKQHK